jgi:hypothetical protein
MMAISAADFLWIISAQLFTGTNPPRGGSVPRSAENPGENLLDAACSLYTPELALFFIVGDKRLSLLTVNSQTLAYGFLLVVIPLIKFITAAVAYPFLGRRVENNVEAFTASFAHPASCQTGDEFLIIYLDADNVIDVPAKFIEDLLKRFGLRDRSGKTIENKASGGVLFPEPLGDDPDNDPVRNELSAIHETFGLNTQVSALADGCTKNVTG